MASDAPKASNPQLTPAQVMALVAQLKSNAAADGNEWPPRIADRSTRLVSSLQQERMWFFTAFDGDRPTNNQGNAWRLSGPVDVDALDRVFAEISRRHEVLRTTFEDDEQGLQQRILATPAALVVSDVDEAELTSTIETETARAFDLTRDPPIRARLLRIDDERHVLVVTMHHIATDGWSLGVFGQELAELYRAFIDDDLPPQADLPFQYADFAAWQRRWLASRDAGAQLDYWRQELRGAPSKLELRRDRAASTPLPFDYVPLAASPATLERAHALAAAEGSTLFMLLLAVLDLVLFGHTGQDDVVVGTLVAGRTRTELEPMIGFFVNVLALRTRIDPSESFRGLLRRVKRTTLDGYAHQELPFERVVEDLQLPRVVGQRPVFQVMLAFQNVDVSALDLGPVSAAALPTPRYDAGADLMFRTWEHGDELGGTLDYDPALFDRSTAERIAAHFTTLLEAAVGGPDRPVSALSLISAAEERRVIYEWNDTAHALDETRCVHELFEAQAARTPDAVALELGSESVTYGELDRRSNQLANVLRDRGCRPGTIVAICMDRSIEMIVALYAVLKAGAAYAPLDPTHPAERLEFLVGDLASPVVLVAANTEAKLGALTTTPLLRVDAALLAQAPSSRPDVAHDGAQDAYVIYTSGSTGTPKGVVNVHAGLRNRLLWMQHEYGLGPGDAVLQKTPYTFDVSVWELFWPLMFGARLVIAAPEGHKDPAYLVETIRSHRITTVHFVPSMLSIFLEHPGVPACATLRRVICSGEALPRALQDRFFERLGCELHNLYGPTEASIDVSYWKCAPDARADVPIGRPIWNTQLYVVDRSGKAAPIGVPGELCIAGVGLARGYWKRPELTAERFVANPFSDVGGARMYRTGDLACWSSDGVLEYLGRIDNQIKLRGFRIELGEIESVLASLPGVRAATVVVRGDGGGDQRLVAYVAPASVDVESAKTALRAKLPDYMVPGAFVALDALPLTSSGKVDRKALPSPAFAQVTTVYVAPSNDAERAIVDVFQHVLGAQKVGIHDDFFALGGHSLLAMRVVARVRSVLGVELPVRDLFEAATPSALAERLTARSGVRKTAVKIPRVDRSRPAPVSFAQSRIWFLDQYERGTATYNVPATMRLQGHVDADVLERVLQELVARHEALRTTFIASSGDPLQVIHPTMHVALQRVAAANEDEAKKAVELEVHRPFDLANGPIVRMTLVSLRADLHLLVLNIHHIATDGWSTGILVSELTQMYAAFVEGKPSPLPPLALDYVDFAAWQRTWLAGDTLGQALKFWKQALAGAETAIELPTDFPRPATRENKGATVRFSLPRTVAVAMRDLCRREGVTPFMVVLAAYQSVLSRWSGQRDVVVGTPIANRTTEELESIVGFFVNSLPMRSVIEPETSFAALVRRVKQGALSAYAHQHLPFEKLVEELKLARDMSRTPVFQVFFAMQNMALGQVELPNVVVTDEPARFNVSKFDLWLTVFEERDVFQGALTYDTALFEHETAERFVGHFLTLLGGALATPDAPIEALPLLTDAERELVVRTWNATTTEPRPETCVHELFAGQAARAPDAIAVEDDHMRLTYAELDDRADRVAGWLVAQGVKPREIVAVAVERSANMLAAVLGVLKAGATYVPIDPTFPEDRRDFMRSSSGCVAELSNETLATALRAPRPAAGTLPRASSTDLAYVLYTSGSTGRPKGVMVEHRALVNFLLSMQHVPGMTATDTLVAVTTLSFDIAGLELYLPLISGARVIIATKEASSDPRALAALIARTQATVLQATPATWRMLLADKWRPSPTLKMLCGGEAITPDLVHALAGQGNELWNMYGPTETTIWSTCIRLMPGGPVSIGRPIENTQVYVLDRHREPAPVGVPGELFIAGSGVARGYLGRDDLTTERFVKNPFSTVAGARMYATGDLARWRRDGTLEYLSRLDHQVKVRGYRIELGEIEAVLSAHPAVKQSVVGVHGVGENKRLVAYVVAETEVEDSHQKQLHDEHVSDWGTAWDLSYGEGSAPADPTFNIAGWNSSYTGTAIPPEEMRAWRDNTVAWVTSVPAKRVLEIGVGTGMILFGVAGQADSYWGYDLSPSALRHIERNLDVLGQPRPDIKLFQRGGSELADLESGSRDTIILNSVIQYFPSVDYLVEVLGEAVRVVGSGGAIRLGDVRSAALLTAFHASVQLSKAEAAAPSIELSDAIRRAVSFEKELVLDPRFFHALKTHLPAIGRVEISPKRGRYDNEMSRFRYDVTLHVGHAEPAAAPDAFERIPFASARRSLRELLAERSPSVLVVTGVPNARVATHAAIVDLLHSEEPPRTVGVLRERLAGLGSDAVHPEDLRALGAELSYRVDLTWSGGAHGELDAVFTPRGPDEERIAAATLAALAGDPSAEPLARFANRPVRQSYERTLVPRLQSSLKERLPDYMVPSAFVMLEALPLTPNGKVDRKALPAPDFAAAAAEYVAPRNPTEEGLAKIWQELLSVPRVGINDDFFSLGGHSLLATRSAARILEHLGVSIPVRVMFEAPTIAKLGAHIDQAASRPKGPTLARVADRSRAPLSYNQLLWWLRHQEHPQSPRLNYVEAYRIRGALDVAVFSACVDEEFRRHEALRTTYEIVDGEPVQIVHSPPQGVIQQIDLRGEPETKIQELQLAQRMRPEPPGQISQPRVILARLTDDEWRLVVAFHRVALDPLLSGTFVVEVTAMYDARISDKPSPLVEPAFHNIDYVAWQREVVATPAVRELIEVTERRLAEAAPVAVPFDHPHPEVGTTKARPAPLKLDAAFWSAVTDVARSESTTKFVVLAAIFKSWLSVLTKQSKIIIIAPNELARGQDAALANTFGCFFNYFVLMTDLAGGPTLREVVRREHKVVLDAYQHVEVPSVLVLDPKEDGPLCRAALNYVPELDAWSARSSSNIQIEYVNVGPPHRMVDFAWLIFGTGGFLAFSFDKFDAETVTRLGADFGTFIQESLKAPDVPFTELYRRRAE